MSQNYNSTQENDNNVLAIFLPIVAVVLVICAGGCYYAERKRRRRLKRGETLESAATSDNESVISASSARYRPYLLPSTTTGRSTRTASRAGIYDIESTYGEPPPYSGGSRRSSTASLHASKEKQNLKSVDRPLSRSRSMLNVRSDTDPSPLRRSQSSLNLRRPSHRGAEFGDRSRYGGDDFGSRRSNFSSPTQSEWSIRTAPPIRNYAFDYVEHRPSSVASLPVRRRPGNIKRSLSQPNLSGSASKTGTYPQGILKRNNNFVPQDMERSPEFFDPMDQKINQVENKGSYQKEDYTFNKGRYDQYYPEYPDGYPSAYPEMRENIYNGSVYSAPGGTHMRYRSLDRPWGPQYTPDYDPYSYGSNYWDQQNGTQQTNRPYLYGAGAMY